MKETMIPPQVGMRLQTERKKRKKEAKKEKKKKRRPKKTRKMREKERRGNATILLPHLCFKVAP